MMISELAKEFAYLRRTNVCNNIVKENVGFYKLSATWVPKMFTDQFEKESISSGRTFLELYQQDEDDLFSTLVPKNGRRYLR